MEQSLKVALLRIGRSPKTLLLLIGALVVVLNAVCFAWLVLPHYADRKGARSDLADSRQRLETVQGMPNPEKATEEQIAAVLNEVPVELHVANVFQTILRYATASNIWINELNQNAENGQGISELEQTIDALSGNGSGSDPSSPAPSPESSDSGGGSSTTPAPGAVPGGADHFEPNNFVLAATGQIPDLLAFYDRMASNPQITSIGTWSLTEIPEKNAEELEYLTDKKNNYEMHLTFTTFTAPSYKQPFGIEDEQATPLDDALRMLEQQYPSIAPFQSVTSESAESDQSGQGGDHIVPQNDSDNDSGALALR